MSLKPGSLANFSGSMASAIENELHALLIADNLPGLLRDNSAESRDVRRLFVAIARGIVAHIAANEDGLAISYLADGTTRHTQPNLLVDWT